MGTFFVDSAVNKAKVIVDKLTKLTCTLANGGFSAKSTSLTLLYCFDLARESALCFTANNHSLVVDYMQAKTVYPTFGFASTSSSRQAQLTIG